MAGVESTRQSFYGGELAARLELKLLPELDGSDVWVQGKQLAELRAETLLLLQNVAQDELEYWSYRLGNITNAIERASVFGESGVVSIG
ncbi:MAG: hypothetical protein V4484_23450 [Pseudomonadota bacterium]